MNFENRIKMVAVGLQTDALMALSLKMLKKLGMHKQTKKKHSKQPDTCGENHNSMLAFSEQIRGNTREHETGAQEYNLQVFSFCNIPLILPFCGFI